jgi:hypothetical protein
MTCDYPYACGNLLHERNTYYYTPYAGRQFLDAWKGARNAVLERLPVPTAAAPPIDTAAASPSAETRDTRVLLECALAETDRGGHALLEMFVKKFETTKRVYEAYDADFRPVNRSAFLRLDLYVRAAELFEVAFCATEDVRYLNVLLKCLDTLSAVVGGLAQEEQARLARLIVQEREHVEALMRRLEI